MSWSLGEVRALGVKAARGAGMDWGIAEEAGFAVEWLEGHGLQGVETLAQYLSNANAHDDYNPKHCPLRLGCLISDMDDWVTQKDASVYEPLLMVPFLASVAENKTLLLQWDKNRIFIRKNNVSTDDLSALVSSTNDNPVTIEIIRSESTQDSLELKTRILKDAKPYIAKLNALAHKTYAPATEASRLAGAGAGLNDND